GRGQARPATRGLQKAHPAVAQLRIALQVRKLDGQEPVEQRADLDHRRTHQAAPAVTGSGDLAATAHIDPGPQDIGATEPVGSRQSLDVTKIFWWRLVVMSEPSTISQPASPGDRIRRDPRQ